MNKQGDGKSGSAQYRRLFGRATPQPSTTPNASPLHQSLRAAPAASRQDGAPRTAPSPAGAHSPEAARRAPGSSARRAERSATQDGRTAPGLRLLLLPLLRSNTPHGGATAVTAEQPSNPRRAGLNASIAPLSWSWERSWELRWSWFVFRVTYFYKKRLPSVSALSTSSSPPPHAPTTSPSLPALFTSRCYKLPPAAVPTALRWRASLSLSELSANISSPQSLRWKRWSTPLSREEKPKKWGNKRHFFFGVVLRRPSEIPEIAASCSLVRQYLANPHLNKPSLSPAVRAAWWSSPRVKKSNWNTVL